MPFTKQLMNNSKYKNNESGERNSQTNNMKSWRKGMCVTMTIKISLLIKIQTQSVRHTLSIHFFISISLLYYYSPLECRCALSRYNSICAQCTLRFISSSKVWHCITFTDTGVLWPSRICTLLWALYSSRIFELIDVWTHAFAYSICSVAEYE